MSQPSQTSPPPKAGGPALPGAASHPSWCAYLAASLGMIGALLNAHAPASPLVAQLGLAAQAVWVVGNTLWLIYAARTRQHALAAQSAVFLFITGYGLVCWGRAVWRA